MKTHQRILLPLLAAGTLAISSCVVVPYDAGYASAVSIGVGYYDSLPVSWNQPYYYYGNRYYYGGRYETGRYYYNGQNYNTRYYHQGHCYYGGRYENSHHHSSYSHHYH